LNSRGYRDKKELRRKKKYQREKMRRLREIDREREKEGRELGERERGKLGGRETEVLMN
jgi:hypothetical protein